MSGRDIPRFFFFSFFCSRMRPTSREERENTHTPTRVRLLVCDRHPTHPTRPSEAGGQHTREAARQRGSEAGGRKGERQGASSTAREHVTEKHIDRELQRCRARAMETERHKKKEAAWGVPLTVSPERHLVAVSTVVQLYLPPAALELAGLHPGGPRAGTPRGSAAGDGGPRGGGGLGRATRKLLLLRQA